MPVHTEILEIERILASSEIKEAQFDELIEFIDRTCTGDRPGISLLRPPLPTKRQHSSVKRLWRMASSLLFYLACGIMVLAALVYSTGPGEVKSLLGYSYFTVMTPSMKSIIPPGSLIITKKTNADQLKIGDVITFFSYDISTTVTHRIVEIIEGEELQFRTKGDDNQSPDPDMISAGRVVGKVIFHAKSLGKVMLLMQENIGWILAVFALLVGLSFTLQQLFRKDVMNSKSRTKNVANALKHRTALAA